MKVKLKYIVIPLAGSGILFACFLLTNEQEKVEAKEVNVIQNIAKPSHKFSNKTQKNNFEFASNFKNTPNKEDHFYVQLDRILNLKSYELPIINLADIAQCPICLQSLQDVLLAGNLSENQLTQLVNLLGNGNHPEIAGMLVETISIGMKQGIDNKRTGILLNGLEKFNSTQIADQFSHYLVDEHAIPFELQNVLTTNIDATTNRTEVAANIVKQFYETGDPAVREKLLSINHPEALALINTQALEQGDTELYQQTSELLKSNPSKYALDALLSLRQMQYADIEQTDNLIESARQLASRQFSGNRLDYIESKLAQGAYPEQDKLLILDILTYSEDKIRSFEIINKFTN